jgi:mRNA interferase HigB
LRVISKRRLRELWEQHADSGKPLQAWHKVAKSATWGSLVEVRRTYPQADPVGRCTVFNIGGNKYRLIVRIDYEWQTIYVRWVLTHKEYDKDDWRSDCD